VDALPVINFDGCPAPPSTRRPRFSFKASDDYGVTGAKLVMTPHARPARRLRWTCPSRRARASPRRTMTNLTPHPYAGLLVDAHLEARECGGADPARAPS